jgi:GrpB-like predicted nucleotidyltransferase (UPF0157 family)
VHPGRAPGQLEPVTGQSVGQEWDERTYRGVDPHPADPRAASVAALIGAARRGTIADHVGNTPVPGLIGKIVVDLQPHVGLSASGERSARLLAWRKRVR